VTFRELTLWASQMWSIVIFCFSNVVVVTSDAFVAMCVGSGRSGQPFGV